MKPLYFLLLNGNILVAFTIMHAFWLVGGRTSIQYFLPTKSKFVKKNAKPNKWLLFFKTGMLAAMAWFCFAQIVTTNNFLTADVLVWGNRAISIVFTLRAIGNFTYVGFSKTFKDSVYAKLDSYIYSPICLILAISSWVVNLLV